LKTIKIKDSTSSVLAREKAYYEKNMQFIEQMLAIFLQNSQLALDKSAALSNTHYYDSFQ